MSGGAERSLRSPPQIPGPQSRFVGGICKGDLKLMLPPLDNYHRRPGRPDPGVGAQPGKQQSPGPALCLNGGGDFTFLDTGPHQLGGGAWRRWEGGRSDFICLMKNDLNVALNLETPHRIGAKENRIRPYFSQDGSSASLCDELNRRGVGGNLSSLSLQRNQERRKCFQGLIGQAFPCLPLVSFRQAELLSLWLHCQSGHPISLVCVHNNIKFAIWHSDKRATPSGIWSPDRRLMSGLMFLLPSDLHRRTVSALKQRGLKTTTHILPESATLT